MNKFNYLQKKKVLFISWDGPKVTYIENLFAPIFIALQEKYNYEFHIIQFTSASAEIISQRKKNIQEKGLHYLAISTAKISPLVGILKAKFLDIYRIKKYIKYHEIDILMPRAINSYFIVQSLCSGKKYKVVWDMDGFPLEERVDFVALSKKSWRYRYFKKLEQRAFDESDSLICRTTKAKSIISQQAGQSFDQEKVFVFSNGTFIADENIPFQQRSNELTIIYVGSLGPQYLLAHMLETFQFIKSHFPDAVFKMLTFSTHTAEDFIQHYFQHLRSSIEIKSVSPDRVKYELKHAHIGISFRKPCFSMQAVAPIKISEYLGSGLSVIYNSGIGDLDSILKDQDFCFCIDIEKDQNKMQLIEWLKSQVNTNQKAKVLKFALEKFSLNQSVDLFHQALSYENR